MRKKIAIIGANDSILNLIRKAKELDYETHVFAWACGAEGEREADFFYPISVDEKDRILEICSRLQLSGVASITSDYAYETVNYVARKLGLPSNDARSELLARNKYEMRCALKRAGLKTPLFLRIKGGSRIGADTEIAPPLIVKPVDGWSSKGVVRIDDFDRYRDAVSYARDQSMSGDVVVEEFVGGPEFSAECISQAGEHHILAVTEKTTTGFPHYVETMHRQPALLVHRVRQRLEEIAPIALNALGVSNGASHIEFKVNSDEEIVIIEIGARMGGDCIGTHLVPMSTGIDYVKAVIDAACGDRLSLEREKLECANAEVRFFFSTSDPAACLKLQDEGKIKIVEMAIDGDEDIADVLSSSDRIGHCVCFRLKE